PALRAGPLRAATPMHLLQQVPLQLRREPARLLRREPLRLTRGDGAADPVGLRRARSRAGRGRRLSAVDTSIVFEPLRFRNLELKNRVLRSSLAGRFNNCDGTGNPGHVNWDLKFARGGG